MNFDLTTIAFLMTCVLVGVLFLAVTAQLYGVRLSRLYGIEIFLVAFALRVGLVLLNEQYGFFDQKLAGERSVEFYLDYISGRMTLWEVMRDQFALQIFLSLPYFAFFGANLFTLQVLNCLYASLSAPVIAILLCKGFSERIARRAEVLFFLYPAAINWSLFGLRDPIIFFSMTVFIGAALCVHRRVKPNVSLVFAAVSCAAILLLRPELSYVIFAVIIGLLLPRFVNIIAGEQSVAEKFGVVLLIALGVGIFATSLGLVSLKIASMQISANTINPLVIAGERAEERYNRAEKSGVGGGTHLVDQDTYANLPIYYRVPVQTVGLVVLPFPWLIKGLSQILAFCDSLFLITVMLFSGLVVLRKRRSKFYVTVLLCTFCIGVLGMGLIVSNAGNGFRMRFALVPLVLIGGAFSRSIPTFGLRNEDEA